MDSALPIIAILNIICAAWEVSVGNYGVATLNALMSIWLMFAFLK